ncbi:MAG: type II secretion system protein N [Marinobacter sp.]|uniref:type II secretion system protein N n=1 Tax=Marinobacter sp. TaxID=50741 RepID=UPI00299D6631|nr:type II secretion system protein N [Marinobacter sp.]MDX1633636.1 type II secretion system protein N [Marinobacter sp.]
MTKPDHPAFLRPAKVVWLLLLGLLVYALVLLFTVPAGWLWQRFSPHVSLPPQVQVGSVSGQVWQGAAAITAYNHPLHLTWDLQMPSLTELSLPVRFTVNTVSSGLQGEAVLAWPGQARLSADGSVRVREFEQLIRRSGGALLAGDIDVERLSVGWADGRLTEARGLARWPGGEVTWPMGNRMESANFPPMEAVLNDADQHLSLAISQAGQSEPAAQADIFADGMLELKVYKRLVDLAGQNWSAAARPGDVIFRVRQPLLPGAG